MNNAAAPVPELPRVGDTLGRKYALVGVLGEGAMGVVFEAVHVRLQQRLAVKILRPDFQGYAEVLARFEREARITAQLRSIHTARVIDVDTLESGLPYIVMEYLEGRDLEVELAVLGALPVEEAVDVVLQVAAAMEEAHANGVVHRDLKPANLYVCRAGGRRVMKVLDFGISRAEGDPRLTMDSGCVGTPCYAAPEQLRDATMADARSDVWSLGTILYELLSGRTPFRGSVTSVIARVMSEPAPWLGNLRPDLPKDLVRLVMATLHRDPAQRFQSMRDFAAALAQFGLKRSTTEALTEAQRGRSRVGEILVSEGLLQPEGLERALEDQRRTGMLLGRTLLELGLVSRADLLAALAKQQGIGDLPDEGAVLPLVVRKQRDAREATTLGHREPADLEAPVVPGALRWKLPKKTRRTVLAAAAGLALGVLGVATVATAGHPAEPTGMVAAALLPLEPVAAVGGPSAVLAPSPDPGVAQPPAAGAFPAAVPSAAHHAAGAPSTANRPAKSAAPALVATAPFEPAGI